jgi:hypothetical protein
MSSSMQKHQKNAPQLAVDHETQSSLGAISESNQLKNARVPGVKSVLVVLSTRAMPFDVESLRHKIHIAYPDAVAYFMNTSGAPIGTILQTGADLIIDFTGPGTRGGWFLARRLRKIGRVISGRNAGPFRKRIYDRVFDETQSSEFLPSDLLERERMIQRQVLAMVGIPSLPLGDPGEDLSRSLATLLPPYKKL